MKLFVLLLTALLAIGCSAPEEAADATPANAPNEEEWIQLFNGENLDGWDVKITGYDLNDNFGNTFRVEDGLLKVSYDEYDTFGGKFGHLFHEKDWDYYRIAVEYRFVGDQAPDGPGWARKNSGIMIHGQPAATMMKDQKFPISIEVQLLGGLGEGDRPTGNLCTPATHVVMNGELLTEHCTNSTSATYSGEEWVRAEVEALGSKSVRHIVDGETVLSYEKPQIGGGTVEEFGEGATEEGKLVEGGSISLQAESHPIHFRKVEILPLKGCMDETAKNYKTYYVEPDDDACQY